MCTPGPSRPAAAAWFAPFPPGAISTPRPMTVSPRPGSRSTATSTSSLRLPTTVTDTWEYLRAQGTDDVSDHGAVTGRQRNDPAQYSELHDEWWEPHGEFAALHWLAAWRAQHLPPAGRSDAVLVDLGCGGGLMGPHVAPLGYRHVGVDIGLPGLALARGHGLLPVGGSALEVPLAEGCADVVLACEVLEHVEDDVAVLAECARLLKPGGTLVIDAVAATWLADLVAVHLVELIRAAPKGIHDPALFVDRRRLTAA